MLGRRQHDAIDQHARHHDLLGRQGIGGGQALDLGDDEALAGLGRHGDRQIVQDQRLALHADIAVRVGGGAADDRDVDRDGLVEQPFLPVDLHHPDEILRADRVELAAALARVDEGADPDPAQQAGPPAGDLAKQLRDAAQRQVPGLDQPVGRHLAELGHQRPVPTDRAPDQPVMRQPIEALLLAVAGGGGEQQAQVARLARGQEPLLQGHEDRIGRADADKARGRHHVARPDDRHRLGRTDHLVAHRHAPARSAVALEPASRRSPCRRCPATCRRRTRRCARPAGRARYSHRCRPCPRVRATSAAG